MSGAPMPKPAGTGAGAGVGAGGMSRSPGRMMLSASPGLGPEETLGTSPSGHSAALSSSNASTPSRYMPNALKRRSTETSVGGGLDDYYFSAYAGAGASSSTSSLAMSPASSHGPSFGGASPTSSVLNMSRGPSAQGHNLRDLIQEEEEGGERGMSTSPQNYLSAPLPRPPFAHQASADSQGPIDSGPSNRRIHVVSYPSDNSIQQVNNRQDSMDGEDRSPGGYSQSSSASHYSSSIQSSDNESFGFDVDGGALKGLLGPEAQRVFDESRSASRIEVRESVDSAMTIMDNYHASEATQATPMQTQSNRDGRFDTRLPNFSYPNRSQPTSPSTSVSAGSINADRTPTLGGPVMSSGRLAFIAPPGASKRSINALQSEMKGSESAERIDMVVNQDVPRSAPPTKSEFDFGPSVKQEEGDEGEGEDTIKGRNRMGRPASTSIASASAFRTDGVLSPEKEVPRRDSLSVTGHVASPSPNKSPQPPPRSTLRPQPSPSPALSRTSSDQPPLSKAQSETVSPKTLNKDLPVIVNTDSSPLKVNTTASSSSSAGGPSRPERSPTRSINSSIHSSATINDLTEMLGGAIDAIGLIDSRETPPPGVTEPAKDDPSHEGSERGSYAIDFSSSPQEPVPVPQKLEPLQPAAELHRNLWPTHPPTPNASLPGDAGYPVATLRPHQRGPQLHEDLPPAPPPDAPNVEPRSREEPLPPVEGGMHQQQQQQIPSVQVQPSPSHSVQSMTPGIPRARPWPAAMLYGNIKGLRSPGDRAKAYAKAINELARAESGLREWCEASIKQTHRPPAQRPVKVSAINGLGVRPSQATLVPEPAQAQARARNVSTSSEFPMRADSYTAREISARMIDPHDQPTALPQNLPYPQLQQQQQQQQFGGMKPSQSMQSMASVSSSSKKGFFSAAIGRMGGGGRKESFSLGPPSANYQPPSAASGSKKDVRALPISAPSHDGPNVASRMTGSISAPLGPRTQHRGSYTPPPSGGGVDNSNNNTSRASLDQGLARMAPPALPARGSMDSAVLRPNKSSAPPRSSPMANQVATFGSPGVKEEDVRQMADVLPHVERSVLRVYLQRHQEPMRAIGALLEDEKRGAVAR